MLAFAASRRFDNPKNYCFQLENKDGPVESRNGMKRGGCLDPEEKSNNHTHSLLIRSKDALAMEPICLTVLADVTQKYGEKEFTLPRRPPPLMANIVSINQPLNADMEDYTTREDTQRNKLVGVRMRTDLGTQKVRNVKILVICVHMTLAGYKLLAVVFAQMEA